MVWRPDCADPETGTVTVDKATTLATMKHKRPEWRLEASLMGLQKDFRDLDPCGSYEDYKARCASLTGGTQYLRISKGVLGYRVILICDYYM